GGRRCAGGVAAVGALWPRGAAVQAQNGDPGRNGDWTLNGDRALDDVSGLDGVPGSDGVPGLDGVPELDGVRRGWLASFESNALTAVLLVEALREKIGRDGGRVVLLSRWRRCAAAAAARMGRPRPRCTPSPTTWRASLARTVVRPTWWPPVSSRIPSSGRAGSATSPGGSARRRPWWAGRGRQRRWRRLSAGCSGRMAAGGPGRCCRPTAA